MNYKQSVSNLATDIGGKVHWDNAKHIGGDYNRILRLYFDASLYVATREYYFITRGSTLDEI